jgi:protein SCO1
MKGRRRLILPVAMSLLALAALVFAIVATRESKGGGSKPATGGATTVEQTQPTHTPIVQGGFQGAEIPGAPPAPPIALSDQYGRSASLSALRGQPVVVAFMYTGCGGPCEVIAQQIRGALDELRRPVPVLLVSVDPAGDTAPAVRGFLAKVSLSGRVYYLTGSPAALARAWRAYRVKPPRAGADAFAREANVLLIDGAGRRRVLFGSEQLTPEALAHDIGRLQAG